MVKNWPSQKLLLQILLLTMIIAMNVMPVKYFSESQEKKEENASIPLLMLNNIVVDRDGF